MVSNLSVLSENFLYLCEQTNFKPCRMIDAVENNGCQYFYLYPANYYILDVAFFFLSFVVFLFFVIFIRVFKNWEIEFQNQRETRGSQFWKAHMVLIGVSCLVWGIVHTFITTMGSSQNFFYALKYGIYNAAQVMLVFIALIDMQLLWDNTIIFIIALVGAAIVCFFSVTMTSNHSLIILMSLGFPVGAQLFHFFAMIPVLIVRRLYTCIIYLVMMLLTSLGPLIIDLYFSPQICSMFSGYFTSSSVAILVFIFYRVMCSIFYTNLKKAERFDGLPPDKKKVGAPTVEDDNLPNIIELDDYSYTYTYTDEDGI